MRDLDDELLQAQVKARLFGGEHAPRVGRLVLLERLGSGGMGTVFAAFDPRLDRRVAVKVLHAQHPDATEQILREARALARLAHPNVIAVHDVGDEAGAVHVVMELVDGTPLRVWLGSKRAWRETVRVLREAGAGLAAAHRAGLVHRDIKPDNIVVGSDRTRVVDFGLAERADEGDAEIAGTPGYLAPEVLVGGPATPASDQYSFGVTLYEALHGRRPLVSTKQSTHPIDAVENLDVADTVKATESPLPPASSSRGPLPGPRHVPGWLDAIAHRAMELDPAKRFPSMDALVAALGRDRRRQRLVAVAVIAGLAIAATTGALLARGDTERASCDGRARRDVAWTESSRQRLRGAIGEAPWAATTLARLDETLARWDASYRRICEATRVTGAQSDRLLELRMRCLDRAIHRLGAFDAALTDGPLGREGPAEVASAVAQLDDPARCEHVEDAAELALPTDPALRARVLDAERALDRTWAMYALGRHAEARASVGALQRAIATLEAPPLHAAVLALAATIEARTGEPATAAPLLERALAAAAAARAFELEHLVWTRLLRQQLFTGEPRRAIEWAPFARAAALRANLQGAEIDGIEAEALRDTGELVRARALLVEALASPDPLRADQRAILELNLGAVDLARSQPELAEAALQRGHELVRGALGDGHPTLALFVDKLAAVERARGRLQEALAMHDQSLALRVAAHGDADRGVATARLRRAETLLAMGERDRARADLEAARALRLRIFGATSPRLEEIDQLLAELARR